LANGAADATASVWDGWTSDDRSRSNVVGAPPFTSTLVFVDLAVAVEQRHVVRADPQRRARRRQVDRDVVNLHQQARAASSSPANSPDTAAGGAGAGGASEGGDGSRSAERSTMRTAPARAAALAAAPSGRPRAGAPWAAGGPDPRSRAAKLGHVGPVPRQRARLGESARQRS